VGALSVVEHAWPSAKEPSLEPDEVHVWRFPLDVHDALVGDLASDLSDEERARAARFTFDRDRRRYIAAHGALRRILGPYLSELPSEVLLVAEPGGKPHLASPATDLRFNLAHSGNLGLLAIGRGREVGIDVERSRDPFDGLESLATSCLSSEELVALRSLPVGERRAAFFATWTRKEAFLKGLGEGLARELDSFDVTVPPAEARLLCVREGSSGWERWTLRDLHPERGFAATVAFEGAATVRCWTWIPEEAHGHRYAGEAGAFRGSGERRAAVLDLARRPAAAPGLAARRQDGITRGVPRPHPDGVDGHEASQPPLRARNLPVDRGPGGDH
jgi:4'-phosphopantetheinyl transferase